MTAPPDRADVIPLLTALAEAAPVGGAILDEDQRFLFVNRFLAEINGRPVEEYLGRSLEDIVGPLAKVVAPVIEQVLRTGEAVRDVSITGELRGRERCWEASYFPLEADGRRAVGAVVTEVTERVAAQAEARARASQQAVVARLGRQALEGADLQDLMDATVVALSSELGTDLATVLEVMPGGDEVLMRSGVGWRPGLVGRARFSMAEASPADFTLISTAPVVVKDLREETRFAVPEIFREHGLVSGMSVAIRVRSGSWGVLSVHTRRPRVFSEDDIGFLQGVAITLAAAIDRDVADRELARVAAQRRRLVAEALDAGENERRRVADQLHDEVLQNLLFARQEWKSGATGRDAQALDRARAALETATAQVRAIVGLLHPVTLAHAGLATAVETMAREESQRGGYEIQVRVDADAAHGEHDQLLLGLVRELLVNVTKHAHARHAEVSIARDDGALVLEVADDGIGLPEGAVAEAVTRGHVGLAAAIERVEALGGRLEVSAGGDRPGTTVRVALPLEAAELGARR